MGRRGRRAEKAIPPHPSAPHEGVKKKKPTRRQPATTRAKERGKKGEERQKINNTQPPGEAGKDIYLYHLRVRPLAVSLTGREKGGGRRTGALMNRLLGKEKRVGIVSPFFCWERHKIPRPQRNRSL